MLTPRWRICCAAALGLLCGLSLLARFHLALPPLLWLGGWLLIGAVKGGLLAPSLVDDSEDAQVRERVLLVLGSGLTSLLALVLWFRAAPTGGLAAAMALRLSLLSLISVTFARRAPVLTALHGCG